MDGWAKFFSSIMLAKNLVTPAKNFIASILIIFSLASPKIIRVHANKILDNPIKSLFDYLKSLLKL